MSAATVELRRFADLRRFALALPGAQAERKWGNVDTVMVGRRMFLVLVLDGDDRPQDVWFRAGRERFLELSGLPGMRPAPYLARAYWTACRTPRDWPMPLWRDWVRASWEGVARRLPGYRQRELGLVPQRAPVPQHRRPGRR